MPSTSMPSTSRHPQPSTSYETSTPSTSTPALPSTSVFPPVPVFVSGPEATAVPSADAPDLSPGPSDSQRSLSQSSPSHILTSCVDMEYTLADLDAIYRDQDSIQLRPMDSESGQLDELLQPAEILTHHLFDFGDIKEDIPDFPVTFMQNMDEEPDDPDSASSGHLVIDQKMPTPQDTEPEGDSE